MFYSFSLFFFFLFILLLFLFFHSFFFPASPLSSFSRFLPPSPFLFPILGRLLSWFRLKSDGALEKSPVDAIRHGTHGPHSSFLFYFSSSADRYHMVLCPCVLRALVRRTPYYHVGWPARIRSTLRCSVRAAYMRDGLCAVNGSSSSSSSSSSTEQQKQQP